MGEKELKFFLIYLLTASFVSLVTCGSDSVLNSDHSSSDIGKPIFISDRVKRADDSLRFFSRDFNDINDIDSR